MRSLPVLIEEIVTKSGGLSSKLADLNLTDEGKAGIETGDRRVRPDRRRQGVRRVPETLRRWQHHPQRCRRGGPDFAASLQTGQQQLEPVRQPATGRAIAELADAINSLEPDAVQNWLETGKSIALVVGGLVAVKRGSMRSKWTKGSGMQPSPARAAPVDGWRHGRSRATPVLCGQYAG